MQTSHKGRVSIILAVVTTLTACIMLAPGRLGTAWSGAPTASIPVSAQATEYSEHTCVDQNVSDILIDGLPTPWNVDKIDVNMLGIMLGKETRTVVEGGSDSGDIGKKDANGLAVEINLNEPTTLYGVYVLVQQSGTAPAISMHVFGYDEIHNSPNATKIYGSPVELIVNTTISWQYHSFGALSLESGRYFLGINGTAFGSSNTWIKWYRAASPSSLYVSEFPDSYIWGNGTLDAPFSYKLVVQTTRVYRPSELAMQLEVAGSTYPVVDGSLVGTGTASISSPAITTNGTDIAIHLQTNRTAVALFNHTCEINLSRAMYVPGYLNSTQGSPNSWLFTPILNRNGNNYRVAITVSTRWYDIRVYRAGSNVTSEIQLLGNTLLIQNATIMTGSTWTITAKSAAIPFSINLPKTSFEPNQTLSFTATPPAIPGNFTIVLFNVLNVEEYRETRPHNNPGLISFNRIIAGNSLEGNACVAVVWQNATDAGIQAGFFSITHPAPNDPNPNPNNPGNGPTMDLTLFGIVIAVIVSAGFLTTIISYKVIHRSRRRVEAERLGITDKLRDLLSLDYLIVLDKKSGIDLYEASFGGFKMDPTLVSGFLSAINSFGQEITRNDEGQVTKLEYEKLKIVMSEYEDFRIAVIMKEAPSGGMVAMIDQLSKEIREKYGKLLKKFDGEITGFQGIKELVEKNLHVSIVSPMRVGQTNAAGLSAAENTLLSRAKEQTRGGINGCFLVKHLFAGRDFDSKAVSALFTLVERKIFVPATP